MMSRIFNKADLRVLKTQKAFQTAIGALLERRKFRQLTVNDLCEEALTSRAAFYTHYKDKYDLLESWFCSLLRELSDVDNAVGHFVYNNTKVMHNILYDSDHETVAIVANSLVATLFDEYKTMPAEHRSAPEFRILVSFCTGGLYEILKLQSAQRHPQEFQSTKGYFLELLDAILDFHTQRK